MAEAVASDATLEKKAVETPAEVAKEEVSKVETLAEVVKEAVSKDDKPAEVSSPPAPALVPRLFFPLIYSVPRLLLSHSGPDDDRR